MGIPLVTGAAGFAGSHLVEHLLETEPVVAAWWNPGGHAPPADDPRVRWRAVDLLDGPAVTAALADLRPSAVYHCAGFASVGGSWSRPARVLQVNAVGTLHLLEAVRQAAPHTRVLVTGSALVYRPSTSALDEEAPLAPVGPYGLSKLAQEMLTLGANGPAGDSDQAVQSRRTTAGIRVRHIDLRPADRPDRARCTAAGDARRQSRFTPGHHRRS